VSAAPGAGFTVESPDGTRLACRRAGSGPVLLLVHGALATQLMYERIAERLRAHYDVVQYDRRGYRPSGPGPGPFDRQAEDLLAVLAHTGGPAHVFAHSAGALAALHALPGAAGRIRSAALYEPPLTLAGDPLKATLGHCRALVAAGRNAEAVAAFLTAVGEPDPALLPAMADLLAPRAPGMLVDLECVTALDPDPARWAAVDVPVRLLLGTESDRVARDSTARLAAALRSPVTELPGQAHHPDDAALVAGVLHAFFRQN
jgi:pimeloyl-ACP methyl ester carboxylesterase